MIEVDSLGVRYGDVTAVSDVSFTAEAGSITALLGPNGAGKTSTIETLEGYRRPDAGRVRVLGLDPLADHRELCRRMGVMLQRGGVYLTMGAAEVLRLFASYWGERAVGPDELLDRLELRGVARTPWRRLSGGEQQRLSLALALVGRPEVALLDEPTAAVDAGARKIVRELVRELRDEGKCVLLTTHDIDEAEKLADHVVILDRGRVVATGSPAVLTQAADPTDFRFGAAAGLDVLALGLRVGATVREEHQGEYVVSTAPNPATVAALTQWLAEHNVPLADLRAGRSRLEDVFLRLTGAGADADPGAATATQTADGYRSTSSRRSSRGRGQR